MSREALPDGSIRITGARVTRHIARLAPGVVLLTAWGLDDGEGFDAMFAEIEAASEVAGRVTIFADTSRVTSMTSGARDAAAKWVRSGRANLAASHLLVRSKLMDMALSLVSLLAGARGRLRTYSSARDFEAAIARTVPGFRGLDAATRAAAPPPAA